MADHCSTGRSGLRVSVLTSRLFLLACLAAALVTRAAPTPSTNTIDPASGFVVEGSLPADPVARAYDDLLAMDDSAQADADRWIRDAHGKKTTPQEDAALTTRIQERFSSVERAYRTFLEKNPAHVDARIALGSFFNDTGREFEARDEWEKALKLNPTNSVVYNNLAGIYGHRGPVTNAFTCYEKAIQLQPRESLYYQNFATTVFLFRRDAMDYYGFKDEQKVFDKSLALYRKALELDPTNFYLASDLAQTYYLVQPPRHDDALAAWKKAYSLAGDELERQGVWIHLARIEVQAGRFDEARAHLEQVNRPELQILRERVLKTLETKVKGDPPPVRAAAPL